MNNETMNNEQWNTETTKYAVRLKYAAGLLLVLLVSSCSILPSGGKWSFVPGRQVAAVEIGTIQVDKNAGWDSVEAEARRFLPLLLAEQGYIRSAPEKCSYRVEAVLIEREYMENWKTRRSLSAEILVWDKGESLLPLAVGKVVLSGTVRTLSSSKELYKMLSSALSSALGALPKK